jgi:hypothetical protein
MNKSGQSERLCKRKMYLVKGADSQKNVDENDREIYHRFDGKMRLVNMR